MFVFHFLFLFFLLGIVLLLIPPGRFPGFVSAVRNAWVVSGAVHFVYIIGWRLRLDFLIGHFYWDLALFSHIVL